MEERLATAEKKIEILTHIIAEMKAEKSLEKWTNIDNKEEAMNKRTVEFIREIRSRMEQ